MAIVFFELQKKQRYLILIFFIVILLTGIVFWVGFFRKVKPGPEWRSSMIKNISIDLKVLESSVVSRMESYTEISFLEGEIGRENPFLPKPLVSPSPLPSSP